MQASLLVFPTSRIFFYFSCFCYCSTSSTLFSNLPIVTHFHKGTIYKSSSVVFLAFHLVLFMDGQILSKDMNVVF